MCLVGEDASTSLSLLLRTLWPADLREEAISWRPGIPSSLPRAGRVASHSPASNLGEEIG